MAKDPVCGAEVDQSSPYKRDDPELGMKHFCSQSCKDRFDRERGFTCGQCNSELEKGTKPEMSVRFRLCDGNCENAFKSWHKAG